MATQPWTITTSDWTCGSLPYRSAMLYEQICSQFDVLHAPEFQPSSAGTRCNSYVWRVTKACGCEIPHYWPKKMTPEQRLAFNQYCHEAGLGPITPFDELSANEMCEWLVFNGAGHGWSKCEVERARLRANAGFPTVAAWYNPSGIGHVAMVLPSPAEGPLLIAQAGKSNLWKAPISQGFGSHTQAVQFWTHD